MDNRQSSYRQIAKATSIFGGVQVFNIIIGVFRSKIAALFLGLDGIGLLGLFNSSLDIVKSITGLGISTSAVRDISCAVGADDTKRIATTLTTVRRLSWMTGFLGMLVMLLLAPWLSEWTFDSPNYVWAFVYLSIIPLLTAVSFGQLAILQGLRHLMMLAKANLYGGLTSLLFLIPLYWWLGIDGIVPLLIIAAFITLCYSYYFARKVAVDNVYQTLKQTCSAGIGMIRLGVMLTISTLAGTSVAYIIRIYISNEGGLGDVGLYSAAYTLVGSYVGLVFTAMGTDYFPRLSAISDDNRKMTELINNQAEIAVLVLSPMVNLFMLFAPYLLMLLYSEKFVPVSTMLQWSMLGVMLQAITWPMTYALLAKAKNNVFLFEEVAVALCNLGFCIMGYNLWGVTGLGVAFLLTFVYALTQIIIINKVLYNIKLNRELIFLFLPQMLLSVCVFLTIQYVNDVLWVYIIGCVLFFLSVAISCKGLEKRVGIKLLIKNRINRNK